jgi:hypothetical protein
MKGIYLTEKGRQELEDKISEIEKVNKLAGELANTALVNAYKEIPFSATILPIEESWTSIDYKYPTYFSQITTFPNGLIIQPKQ